VNIRISSLSLVAGMAILGGCDSDPEADAGDARADVQQTVDSGPFDSGNLPEDSGNEVDASTSDVTTCDGGSCVSLNPELYWWGGGNVVAVRQVDNTALGMGDAVLSARSVIREVAPTPAVVRSDANNCVYYPTFNGEAAWTSAPTPNQGPITFQQATRMATGAYDMGTMGYVFNVGSFGPLDPTAPITASVGGFDGGVAGTASLVRPPPVRAANVTLPAMISRTADTVVGLSAPAGAAPDMVWRLVALNPGTGQHAIVCAAAFNATSITIPQTLATRLPANTSYVVGLALVRRAELMPNPNGRPVGFWLEAGASFLNTTGP